MSQENLSLKVLKKIVVDGLLLCGLTVLLFAVKLLWEPFQRGFFCGDESLMYPYQDDTVTVTMLRIGTIGVPLLTFLICEVALLRSEKEDQRCLGVRVPPWLCGFYCTAAAFGFGFLFCEITTEFAKHIIGRPRPHFFDLCQPSIDCNSTEWKQRYVQSYDYHCIGHRTEHFKDMRKSFLSGHSSASAYAMVFLTLYLEKRMVWSGTRTLRHTLQFFALMFSWYTALSRISDFKHHWSDVLAGYSLGLAVAVITWFWCTDLVKRRKDHAPLTQNELQPNLYHITAESA